MHRGNHPPVAMRGVRLPQASTSRAGDETASIRGAPRPGWRVVGESGLTAGRHFPIAAGTFGSMLAAAMGIEIERKFLPKGDAWRRAIDGQGGLVRQGYLLSASHCTVRVRVTGESAWMTVKGITTGASRAEYEYPVPLEDATAMLESLCEKPLIEKTRYVVRQDGIAYEIDEFHGANAGLVVIEVELASEDQAIRLPDWIGTEVTGDARYRNSGLVRHPYAEWAVRE